MTGKRTKSKPIRKGRKSPQQFARRAREIQDHLIAQDRCFSDSTEIVRADRESR